MSQSQKPQTKKEHQDRRVGLEKYLGIRLPSWRTQQQPCDQQKSTFFSKLPLELRIIIYKHVLNRWPWSDALHVVEGYQVGLQNITRHADKICVPCAAESGDPYSNLPTYDSHWRRGHATCKAMGYRKGRSLRNLPHGGQILKYLSFLQTCQRIYSEAINLLYSEFKLDLCGLDTTYSFLTFLPKECLKAIRFLTFDLPQSGLPIFPPPGRYGQSQLLLWSVVRHLAEMTELQQLKVKIYDTEPTEGWDERLLRALVVVRIPKLEFLVELSWDPKLDGDVNWKTWEYAPFTIKRKVSLLENDA